jgi:hypothetical protein
VDTHINVSWKIMNSIALLRKRRPVLTLGARRALRHCPRSTSSVHHAGGKRLVCYMTYTTAARIPTPGRTLEQIYELHVSRLPPAVCRTAWSVETRARRGRNVYEIDVWQILSHSTWTTKAVIKIALKCKTQCCQSRYMT